VVSVLGSVAFLGEEVTLVMAGGGLLILAGVAVAGSARSARSPTPAAGSLLRAGNL
jgi:drug/metabolite transporter (DMT)-like permease